ncbi:hypothetical protein BGV71_12280 [Burkholderia ubonensis]|nr:hypothetical protein WI76_00575 [Burkholderia ubonensis]KVT84386.1 hypothetical protein WK59_13040 [Burkholderia ubonensis]KVZ12408.1 hypothetical protein WL13_00950 [Burkholderia ubonensis]KWC26650.1 hypothetical protein WL50_07435 [Burkholderia ubonensis]OJA84522.1 hypothetical protein BGV71_12280 [Burkholderia ubonensis]
MGAGARPKEKPAKSGARWRWGMRVVTDEMLTAALQKAVELGLLPKQAPTEVYLTNCDAIKAVVQAALDAS